MQDALSHAFALQKQAAARANRRLSELEPALVDAIEAAAASIAKGEFDDEFPLVVWQTGSGTQTNMNLNVVIAGRATEALGGKRGGKRWAEGRGGEGWVGTCSSGWCTQH